MRHTLSAGGLLVLLTLCCASSGVAGDCVLLEPGHLPEVAGGELVQAHEQLSQGPGLRRQGPDGV